MCGSTARVVSIFCILEQEVGEKTDVFGSPEQDHAFKKRCACAAGAHEEVEICSCNEARWIFGHLEAVFCCCDFEEGHLAPNVV